MGMQHFEQKPKKRETRQLFHMKDKTEAHPE